MRRALTLALLLAAADAGLRIGKPSGAGALKMATREEAVSYTHLTLPTILLV